MLLGMEEQGIRVISAFQAGGDLCRLGPTSILCCFRLQKITEQKKVDYD